MPLPVAHTAAAIASYLSFRNGNVSQLSSTKKALLISAAIVMANAPDLDFLPGLVIGQPNRFHHGPPHSLAFACLLAFAMFMVIRTHLSDIGGPRLLILLILASLSHPLLDLFSIDTSAPLGVPLFWPISDAYYMSPTPLFSDVMRSGDSLWTFAASFLNAHNLQGALGEFIFGTTLIMAALTATHPPSTPRFRQLAIVTIFCLVAFYIFQLTKDLP